jgi:hypothetical protein
MDIGMQHVRSAWICSMDIGHSAWAFSIVMQHRHALWTLHAAEECSMNMSYELAA